MLRLRVDVKRRKYDDRSTTSYERLYLTLSCRAKVADDSHLSIGTGALSATAPDELYKLAKHRKIPLEDIEKLSQKIKISEKAIFRLGKEVCIPGSSLKGAIRSRAELLFIPVGGTVGCCFRAAYLGSFIVDEFNKRHVQTWGRDVLEYGRPSCEPPDVCILCDLFGAPGLLSKVSISDAKPTRPIQPIILTLLYDGREEQIEAIPPSSEFTFSVEVNGATVEQAGLLFMGMRSHEGKPILIGRHKYASRKTSEGMVKFGRLFIEVLEVKVREESRQLLDSMGVGLKLREGVFIIEDVKSFVKKCVEVAHRALKGELRDVDETRGEY